MLTMKNVLKVLVVVVVFGLFYGFSQLLIAANDDTEKQEQRKEFLEAEKAIENNDTEKANELLPKLTNYPLYPYLLYDELTKNIGADNATDVTNFLKKYSDSPLAGELRQKWFKYLLQQKNFQEIVNDYPKNTKVSTTVQCIYMQGLIATGKAEQTKPYISELWVSATEQPKECMPVFSFWARQGYMVDDYVWERMNLALNAGNFSLARDLVSWLPEDEQKTAKIWLSTYKNPKNISKINLNKDHKQTKNIVTHGLTRLAEVDANSAFEKWHTLAQKYALSGQQQKEVQEAIALGLIQQDPNKAKKLVPTLKKAKNNTKVSHWQLQQHIKNDNWGAVQNTYDKLPETQQKKIHWQYWYARSLDELGKDNKANDIFNTLSVMPHYYGVMSSVRLSKDLPIKHKAIDVTDREKQQIVNMPGVQRTGELYMLGRYQEAENEWNNALSNMNDKQAYIAAKIAQQWGMTHLAVRTGETVKHHNDIELMFPLKYQDTIVTNASKNGIEPAWIYGVIRQESRFHPAARSGVGAQGLMQLMPATARQVAKHHDLKVSTSTKGLQNPTTNITLGSAYLSTLLKRYKNHGVLATASYNAGPGNVNKWLPTDDEMAVDQWVELIPFDETRGYVKNVLVNTAVYQNRLKEKKGISKYIKTIPPRSEFQ